MKQATFRHENIDFKEKLAECECQQKLTSSNAFCVDCLTSDGHISFYIGLSSSEIFMAMFDQLNPGDNCENICPGGNMRDVPEDFYDSDCIEEDIVQATMKGERSKLKLLDKFFGERDKRSRIQYHLSSRVAIM